MALAFGCFNLGRRKIILEYILIWICNFNSSKVKIYRLVKPMGCNVNCLFNRQYCQEVLNTTVKIKTIFRWIYNGNAPRRQEMQPPEIGTNFQRILPSYKKTILSFLDQNLTLAHIQNESTIIQESYRPRQPTLKTIDYPPRYYTNSLFTLEL